MSFPSSPSNGQIAVLNGITYLYSLGNRSWTRVSTANIIVTGNVTASNLVATSNVITSNLIFSDSTVQTTAYPGTATVLSTIDANIGTLFLGNASTNANIGAFQTWANATFSTGGGSSYGNASVAAYLTLGTYIGSGTTTANLVANATTISANTTTGALVVRGGAGVAGNLNVGGNLRVTSNVTVVGSLSGGVGYLLERANVVSASAPATTNIDLLDAPVMYWNANCTANVTANIRGSATTTLNSVMGVNQTATLALFLPNGSTPYFVNTVRIDNTIVSPVWLNGNTVASGNANSIDVYTFTIIKTASAAYKVFATQSTFQHTG